MCVLYIPCNILFQFNTKSSVGETGEVQLSEETTVPEDITDFYSKMDKADEEDEEETNTNTVSFEVNQVITGFLIDCT